MNRRKSRRAEGAKPCPFAIRLVMVRSIFGPSAPTFGLELALGPTGFSPLQTYLDFEKSIAEIETKIEELSALAESSGAEAMGVELSRLKQKASKQLEDIYSKLDPWQKTQVARHQDRPRFRDYVAALVTDFVEMSGDRGFGEDAAILGGTGKFLGRPCMMLGHEKGRTTQERLKHNFGSARPEGYRKAVRLMDLAEKFNLPVIALVDTQGAYPASVRKNAAKGRSDRPLHATLPHPRHADGGGNRRRRHERRRAWHRGGEHRADAGACDLFGDQPGGRGLHSLA